MKFFNKTEFKLFISILLIFFFFIHWIGWGENSRLDLTRAIVDKGQLEIDDYYNNTGDRSFFNGHYYSDKAPGLSLFSVPIYILAKAIFPDTPDESIIRDPGYPAREIVINQNPGLSVLFTMIVGIFIFSSILTALTAILIYRISKYFVQDKKIRILIPLIYAFGTLAFPNALAFYGHAASTFFIFLSFYIIFTTKLEKKTELKYFLLAGISAGTAFLIEYTTVFLFLGVLIISLTFRNRIRAISVLLVSFFIASIPVFVYNYAIFGNPLEFSYLHFDLYDIDTTFINEKLNSNFTIDNVQTASRSELFLKFNFDPESVLYHLNVIIRALFYPYRGLFFYYPILILSFLGLWHMYKKYRYTTLGILIPFLLVLWFISTPYFYWWGGSVFGPRHMLIIIPFLMIPLAFFAKKIPIKLFIILFSMSLVVNILGLQPTEDSLSQKYLPMSQEYLEKINSMQPFGMPLFEYYLPRFLENGFQSKVLNGILFDFPNIDIRDSLNYERTKLFTITNIGIFVFKSSHLRHLIPIYLIAILMPLLVFIWSKELSKKFKTPILVYPLILLGIVTISASILAIKITDFAYDKNWYKESLESPKWMSQDGTISYFSSTEKVAFLNIPVGVYNESKILDLYLNDSLVDHYLISSGEELITNEFNLKKGENTFLFHIAGEGCSVPDDDSRCLGFSIGKITEVNPDLFANKIIITTLKDFYTDNGIKKFAPRKFSFLVYSRRYTMAHLVFSVRSYYRPRDLEISIRGKPINHYDNIKTAPTYITTSDFLLEKGVNKIDFFSNINCDTPSVVENSTDYRCIAFEVTKIEILQSEKFSVPQ